jgi:hypothetical protein
MLKISQRRNKHEADTRRTVAYRKFEFIFRDTGPLEPTEILQIPVESTVSLVIKFMNLYFPLFLLVK